VTPTTNPISILGINSVYHESSACLIQDGQLVAVAEEERFNRIKHGKPAKVDNADELPEQAIAFCLRSGGLDSIANVDFIGYSFEPEDRLRKNLEYRHDYTLPDADFGTIAGEQRFYNSNLSVEQKIRAMGYQGRFFYLDHHACHAASAFYVSGYEDSAVLVLDGIGEFESTTFFKGQGTRLNKIRHFEYPNSLGFLWEKISAFLGFSPYDAAKVMGLSSYGEPGLYKNKLAQLLHIGDDGTFSIDDDLAHLRNGSFQALENLFGTSKLDKPVSIINSETQKYADIAVALQIATEEIIIKLARQLQLETGSQHLCMAGGVTLNCVANGYLSYEKIFDNFYVQPAANDAGTSIGAAYLIWHRLLGYPRQVVSKSPYLGPNYSDDQIKAALVARGLAFRQSNTIEAETARLLADGKIIAWFQGRMELGPRALGNRSLLADPRSKDTVELMNLKVKHREAFRPFCPSVLAERAAEWFELPEPMPEVADYMLGAFRAKKDKAHLIPAVVHFDGTSRIQAVRSDTNPKFHRLLTEMEQLTGVPVLLNTSFNDQEPIVCTPDDAITTFLKTEIDYLAIGNYLVAKSAL
jgi:carbamoyltransferase